MRSNEPGTAAPPAAPLVETSRPRHRFSQAIFVVALAGAVCFVLVGIGSPLLGRAVFAATDELARISPYADWGLAGTEVQNTYQDDTYNAELPAEMLFASELRSGEFAAWNPYIAAGTPLGSVPNYALLSPLTLPFYLLPAWLAPGYQKLLELAVAIAGCALFLRRLRLGRPAAVLGGIVFASSAFMVMWTNWPQTRTAAMIPWVFWAAERLIQRRSAADAALLSLSVGVMLFGGFPAVTGYTLLTVVAYLAVRALIEYRRQPRRLAGVLLGAVGGAAGGVALAAVQLLPFAYFYRTWLIEGRAQTGADHLELPSLATSFAPWTFGGVARRADQPFWYLPQNMVEASSYLGAAALVLAVVAVAASRRSRSVLPRGVWSVMVAAALTWLVLIYFGGPLPLLQQLPVFDTNFIGRARSVLGFLFAVLAAIGFEVLVRRPPGRPADSGSAVAPVADGIGARRRWPARLVVVAALGVLILAIIAALRAASGPPATAQPAGVDRLAYAGRQLAIGGALIAVAVLAVLVLRAVSHPRSPVAAGSRVGAASVLIALVVGQGLAYVGPYWPRVDRSTFYPETDTHQFLAANLGHERYAGTTGAMSMGLDAPKRLRALSGHTFLDADLAELLRAVPGHPVHYPTHVLFDARPDTATSPVLDRLSARFLVASPRDQIFGRQSIAEGSDGSVTLRSGRPARATITTAGPLRGIGITPTAPFEATGDGSPAPTSRIDVVITDPDGAVLATGGRIISGLRVGRPFWIPVAAEAIPTGTDVTVAVTARTGADLPVTASRARPAVSTVTAPAGGDGLRLAYAGSAVVWQRLHALPRVRWAEHAVVVPDPQHRVALLADGAVPPDTVVLSAPGPGAEGKGASIRVDSDGTDAMTISVAATGAGYLVVADALQAGWAATVDGEPVPLVAADHGVVAVPITAGNHKVALRYAAPYHNVGSWLSLAAALITAGLLVAGLLATARRRSDGSPTTAHHTGELVDR